VSGALIIKSIADPELDMHMMSEGVVIQNRFHTWSEYGR